MLGAVRWRSDARRLLESMGAQVALVEAEGAALPFGDATYSLAMSLRVPAARHSPWIDAPGVVDRVAAFLQGAGGWEAAAA